MGRRPSKVPSDQDWTPDKIKAAVRGFEKEARPDAAEAPEDPQPGDKKRQKRSNLPAQLGAVMGLGGPLRDKGDAIYPLAPKALLSLRTTSGVEEAEIVKVTHSVHLIARGHTRRDAALIADISYERLNELMTADVLLDLEHRMVDFGEAAGYRLLRAAPEMVDILVDLAANAADEKVKASAARDVITLCQRYAIELRSQRRQLPTIAIQNLHITQYPPRTDDLEFDEVKADNQLGAEKPGALPPLL